jgi:hypothetical protein
MTRPLQDQPNASAGQWFRNTAALSRELSVGDVVAVGEVPLAVAKAGWTPVAGGLNEARSGEPGTRPLPATAKPGEPAPETPAKEYRDDCP